MFLHLGGNTIVRTKDVVAILNAENHRGNHAAQLAIKAPSDATATKNTGEETKSFVITDKAVYLSPISSGTLKKRAEYLAELNK